MAIILVIVSLLFPPFGYTRITITTISKTVLGTSETHLVMPWTYVRHSFIFSPPPNIDWDLTKIVKSDANIMDDASVDDMRIAWPLVAIEVAVIVLIASGAIFTLRIHRRRKTT